MYSFEWPVAGGWSWRSQVHSWDNEDAGKEELRVEKRKSGFTLDMVSDNVLADAGWHCTNCYKKPEDLIAKLRGECRHEPLIFSRKKLILYLQINLGPRPLLR